MPVAALVCCAVILATCLLAAWAIRSVERRGGARNWLDPRVVRAVHAGLQWQRHHHQHHRRASGTCTAARSAWRPGWSRRSSRAARWAGATLVRAAGRERRRSGRLPAGRGPVRQRHRRGHHQPGRCGHAMTVSAFTVGLARAAARAVLRGEDRPVPRRGAGRRRLGGSHPGRGRGEDRALAGHPGPPAGRPARRVAAPPRARSPARPLLDGALAALECRTFAVTTAATTASWSAGGRRGGSATRPAVRSRPARPGPLIHHAGRYRRLRPDRD